MPFKKGQSGNPAGRKPGTKLKVTIDREEAKAAHRALVLAHLEPMTKRQIEHAMGIKFMMVRQAKGGKWTRVTAEMAEKGFEGEDEVVEVFEKDPSIQAYTDLANRALGKPPESLEASVTMPGMEGLLERLLAARKRVQ